MTKYCLSKNSKLIEIDIEQKNIKNLNLRVLSDCSVKCSIPFATSKNEIKNFLDDKASWIFRHIDKFNKLELGRDKDIIRHGGSVKILGRQYYVNIEEAEFEKVEVFDLYLTIYTKNKKVFNHIEKQFSKFFIKEAKNFYKKIINKFYPIIKKHGIDLPNFKVRKMKTRWGTCNINKKYITLNEFLYKAPPSCIEYVILHELTHFLYPRHNAAFYSFLGVHMPDWKDRKIKLDSDIIKNID